MAESKYDLWTVGSTSTGTVTATDTSFYKHPSRFGLHLPPKQQHWFKERLRTQIFKERRKEDAHKFLVGRNWTFVKDGLEDFRTGVPPDEGDASVLRPKPHGVIGPNIFPSDEKRNRATEIKERARLRRAGDWKPTLTKEPIASKCPGWSKEEKKTLVFGRSTLTQTARKQHIQNLEDGLLAHPLSLLPHLQEGMPPDVFETVVDILDPELNIASEAIFDDDPALRPRRKDESLTVEHGDQSVADITTAPVTPTQPGTARRMTEHSPSEFPSDTLAEKTAGRLETTSRRTSLAFDQRHIESKRRQSRKSPSKGSQRGSMGGTNQSNNHLNTGPHGRRKKSLATTQQESPSLDIHISNITKDFCEWVANIGGETNNIEEATVESLFASGYETKPALSVPIHIVDDSSVPIELKGGDETAPPPPNAEDASSRKKGKEEGNKRRVATEWLDTSPATNVAPGPRFRYGAWYLRPRVWRVLEAGEGLEDPKKVEDKEMSEGKLRSAKLDLELAPLHGSKVFIEYLEKKESRIPNFLSRVAILQEDMAPFSAGDRNTTTTSKREGVSRAVGTARSKGASRGGN